jgi:hypothetical protein
MCELYAVIVLRDKDQYRPYHYKYIKLKTDQHLLQQLVTWYIKRSGTDLIIVKKDELSPSFKRLFILSKIVKFFIISSADKEMYFTVAAGLEIYTFSAAHHTSFLTIDNCNSIYSIKI